MGKRRRKQRTYGKRRFQSSGTDPNKSAVPNSTKRHHCNSMLEKLKCENPAERQWACHSLANIAIQEEALKEFPIQQLLSNGLLENLSHLIVNDPHWIIREAAFGVLRNLSLSFGEDLIERIVTSNALEHIAAALKQSHEVAEQFSSGSLQPSEGLTSETLFSTTEQCLYLLMTVSEANSSPKLMEVIFQPEFLLLLIHYITSFVFPTKHRALAAQCMLTLTEDKKCCQVLLQSLPETVTTLTSFLSLSVDDQYHILARVSVAGVTLNLLSEITDFSLLSQLTQQMATVLVGVIDINFDSLMEPLRLDSANSASSNNAILDQGEVFLQSIQTALELVANLCYKEDEEDDGDCDERQNGLEDEDIMVVENPQQIIPTVVSVITETQLHRKILRWCQFSQNDYNILTAGNVGSSLYKKIPAVQERAVIAIMNIVTVLPLECWGEEGVAALWSTLCQIASLSQEDINEDNCDIMEPCLNTIVTLCRKCQEANIIMAIGEELTIFFQLKDNASSPTLRACVVAVIGAIGKTSLVTSQPERFTLLEPIISSLKDTVEKETSLIVCCHALDSMFDILGHDNCPPELITIDLLALLQTTNKMLRTQVQKEELQHLEKYGVLIDTVQTNLPLFIEYLKNQN